MLPDTILNIELPKIHKNLIYFARRVYYPLHPRDQPQDFEKHHKEHILFFRLYLVYKFILFGTCSKFLAESILVFKNRMLLLASLIEKFKARRCEP